MSPFLWNYHHIFQKSGPTADRCAHGVEQAHHAQHPFILAFRYKNFPQGWIGNDHFQSDFLPIKVSRKLLFLFKKKP